MARARVIEIVIGVFISLYDRVRVRCRLPREDAIECESVCKTTPRARGRYGGFTVQVRQNRVLVLGRPLPRQPIKRGRTISKRSEFIALCDISRHFYPFSLPFYLPGFIDRFDECLIG